MGVQETPRGRFQNQQLLKLGTEIRGLYEALSDNWMDMMLDEVLTSFSIGEDECQVVNRERSKTMAKTKDLCENL